MTDALGHQTSFAYNSAGLPARVTDHLNNITRFTYDGGDLTGITDPLGRSTSRSMDAAGRLVSITNALGQTTRYEYDALNQPTRAIDALGGEIVFSHDPNGNLLSLTDARGKTTSYTYDSMDRRVTRTDPLGRADNYEYDPAGNLKKFTDRRGKISSYLYDGLDRITLARYGTTADPPYESTISYTYDAMSRLTQVNDSLAGLITLNYDNLDRLTSEVSTHGTVGYGYDTTGRRTSMTVTGQSAISYSYDDADRLTEIRQGSSIVGFGYDEINRQTRLTLPNNLEMAYAYDRASQLTGITYRQGAAEVGDLTYGYDAVGRRTQTGGSLARTGLPQPLASANYNDANQLTARGGATFTYDANGNLTSDGANTYTWDARNRLASISGSVNASFQYDAFGRRVAKTINGQSTEYLYDGINAVQELAGGTPIANLLTGGVDKVFTRTDGDGTRMFLTDGLGSTLALLDPTGAVQTQYTYEPFGGTTTTGAASSNATQYTGRENDGIGLYYYRARYYSPSVQRFISEDPIEYAGGDINLYSYVGGNPLSYVDPLGLWSITVNAYAGVGGGITFGRDPNTGQGFATVQFGWGLGGGFSWELSGGQPGSSPTDYCGTGGIGLGLSADAKFNYRTLQASLENKWGRNYPFGKQENHNYGPLLKPSWSLRDSWGINASWAAGGEITIWTSGRKGGSIRSCGN